jgi:hypothetical protein
MQDLVANQFTPFSASSNRITLQCINKRYVNEHASREILKIRLNISRVKSVSSETITYQNGPY